VDLKKLSHDELLANYGCLLAMIAKNDLTQKTPLIIHVKMTEWAEEMYQEIVRRMMG